MDPRARRGTPQPTSRPGRPALRRAGPTVSAVLLLAACSGGGDEAASEPVDDETVAASSAADATGEDSAGEGEGGAQDDASSDSSGGTEEDGSGSEELEAADPGEDMLRVLLDDPQALCDTLDEAELRSVVGDFVELRPDEVTEVDSLCSMRDDRREVGRVWIQADWSELEFLHSMAADPYEPCQVGDYDAVCQTDTGNPEMANGWPHVAIRVGSMGVETQAPDPETAQQLAEAVMDDVLAQGG